MNREIKLTEDIYWVGKIDNISVNGLAFDYIHSEAIKKEGDTLDIFFSGGDFALYNLPCEVMHDMALHVPKLKSILENLLTTRRCGVRFGNLSVSQRQKLQAFIDSQPATD